MIRVSIGDKGQQLNDWTSAGDMSSDGRYVVFCTNASNVVGGDNNANLDVFIRDVTAGTTKAVSAAADGTIGNDRSCGGAMTPDSRYVAFDSQATNLVPGTVTHGQDEEYVKDTVSGAVTLVSVANDGTIGDDDSNGPSISTDGRYVAFGSMAGNFPPGTVDRRRQIYIRDLLTRKTTEVSITPNGAPGNGASSSAAISADGRYVAFGSSASDLVAGDTNGVLDVFVRDMTTGTTTRVSVDPNGKQENYNLTYLDAISPDGRFVLFDTVWEPPLCCQDSVQRTWLHDSQTGTTSLIGVSSSGAIGNGASVGWRISADDRYVMFGSMASNLVACDTNKDWDGFLRDLKTGTTTRVTLSGAGGQMAGGGGVEARTPDGRYLLIDSWAANMTPGDTNRVGDLFRRDTTPGTTPAAPLMARVGPANRADVPAVPISGCAGGGLTVHVTVRDSTHHAVFAVPVSRGAWSVKANLSHFADGKLSVLVYATNAAGVASGRVYTTLRKDTVSPTAHMTAPTTSTIPRTVTAHWTGSDNTGGSGVASYDLRWRYGRSSLSAYVIIGRGTRVGYRTFTNLAAGTTYCWSVRDRDNVGNLSAWSPDRCATTS